jgi:GNAT superfamily N-acetyltransferase
MRVRPLQQNDCEPLKHLIRTVWTEHFGSHPDEFVREYMNEPGTLVDIDPMIYPLPKSVFLVAVQDSVVVGSGAILAVSETVCEVMRMYTSLAIRRQGVARRILTELLAFAEGAGYSQVRLTSNKALLASHRLYESFGFSIAAPWDSAAERYAYFYARRLG